jgi:hypothetical protein
MEEDRRCPAVRRSQPDVKVLGVFVDGRVRFIEDLTPLSPEIERIAAEQNLHINRAVRLTATC